MRRRHRGPPEAAERPEPAIDQGHRSPADRAEDALDPLLGREDFRLLMMDLAMPADSFAAAR